MLSPDTFCSLLKQHGITQYYGVPDSLLKNLCSYIDSAFESDAHVITANEGNAVAMAMGHYLGSGKPAVVYMQNSGLGNVINPLVSLADPDVYSIPMLLVIGWRGEPGVKDEPQHIKQGRISEQQLNVLDIPYVVFDSAISLEDGLKSLLQTMNEQSRPVAVLVKSDTFKALATAPSKSPTYTMNREQALTALLPQIPLEALIVSTTGKTSREVFEIRKACGQKNTDFLTVGGMGHTLSIAIGVAKAKPQKLVVALDGDGSMLMHMGSLAVAGNCGLKNLVHVVLNNECHDSVGGQPTVAGNIDIERIALGCGYSAYQRCETSDTLIESWKNIESQLGKADGPMLFEVKINQGARADLGRPTSTPVENKHAFMQHSVES